jgi:RNA polymerase sigma-70 factor (ECF subfamily)
MTLRSDRARRRRVPHVAATAPGVSCPEALFAPYAAQVRGLARRLLGSADEAEAVTQEVFLRLTRCSGRYRDKVGLATWLHRATVNAALLRLRRGAAPPPA